MDETQVTRTPVDHPYWYGWLCRDNFDAVAARIQKMLTGQWYTFVTANSYSEDSKDFYDYNVHAGRHLVERPRITHDPDGYAHMSFHDQSYVWGLMAKVQTEHDARTGSIHDRTHLVFNDSRHRGESVTIDQFAPAGYRLLWTIVVENRDPELALFNG